MMTRFLPLFTLLFSAVVHADVEVSTSLKHDTFLRYEGIPLTVKVENDTGHPLLIGGTNANAELRLDVRNVKGHNIGSTKLPLLEETWYIPTDETDEKVFDLLLHKQIRRPDQMRVIARVRPFDTEQFYQSPLKRFEVVNGTEFDSLRIRKEDRSFILKGINRGQGDYLVLQVATAKRNRFLVTYELERHLRFYPPEIRKDEEGRVHTLHYVSPQIVVHCGFEAKGKVLFRDYYSVAGGPRVYLRPGGPKGMVVPGGTKQN